MAKFWKPEGGKFATIRLIPMHDREPLTYYHKKKIENVRCPICTYISSSMWRRQPQETPAT